MTVSYDATIHVRLENELRIKVYDLAKQMEVKPSVVVRLALEEYVKKEYKRTTLIDPSKF